MMPTTARFCCVFILLCAGLLSSTGTQASEQAAVSVSRIEVVLASHYRNQTAELKAEFAQAGFHNAHFQFVKMGQPPQNIGLGREVPAEKAREVIRLALKYNLGVGILLPERLFPPRFVTIASSNYDDTVEYPIDAAALERLKNPELTTEAFHQIYRELTSVPLPPKGRY